MKTSDPFIKGYSKIPGAGLGLFAEKDFAPGDILFVAFFRSCEADNITDPMPQFELQYTQAYPNNFVNHSDTPNTANGWEGSYYIVKRAIKPIKKGEEITSSYDHGMKIIIEAGFKMDNWKAF